MVFEGYDEQLGGVDATDITLNGFMIEADGSGWIVGCKRTLPLPQARFLNFQDMLERVFPKYKETWKHSGNFGYHEQVDVIPEGMLGEGMVLVQNLSELTAVRFLGRSRLGQEEQKRERDYAILADLGFVER